ncbi:hypothetical protein THF1C08_280059 [Vibrio jasicida]|uniref:Uncharacterized protein n=1 Tax=Vibrio jasicida TaxID=766224 RepID=A0AAU9QNT8_9VIBR|nr:hypothetical protein THF1C08_280059 [Vibrio jasicida]CAH1593801.1 hypothetical protein THF1A12_270059 [Vibrio jasicida]
MLQLQAYVRVENESPKRNILTKNLVSVILFHILRSETKDNSNPLSSKTTSLHFLSFTHF